MKNNLPKKSAAKAVKGEASSTKKVSGAKASKTAAAPKAAVAKKKVAASKPATTKVITATKTTTAKAAKPAPAKPTPLETTFVAQTEIGWGNSLYLRGEGAPELSWERGILMKWVDGSWVYSTTDAKAPVCFKFLVNDQIWASGNNQRVEPGSTSISTPHFQY